MLPAALFQLTSITASHFCKHADSCTVLILTAYKIST